MQKYLIDFKSNTVQVDSIRLLFKIVQSLNV